MSPHQRRRLIRSFVFGVMLVIIGAMIFLAAGKRGGLDGHRPNDQSISGQAPRRF
ncbi:hypothetical protein [Acetobacter fallax]|uniref:Uncharacterized protein n=1 Tax=Acetobacter fallax TaxID=1737473 RepID=A0ABX0KD46_9PROT|nr:hypothetical protein [Acetobacter fallax]NHO33389.1 hypothetical protein [Acetobacter fallax]NHO37008.1 hypothetical protein [Acetobacter fallax]